MGKAKAVGAQVCGMNCIPPSPRVGILTSGPPNVTLFGDRNFAGVTSQPEASEWGLLQQVAFKNGTQAPRCRGKTLGTDASHGLHDLLASSCEKVGSCRLSPLIAL